MVNEIYAALVNDVTSPATIGDDYIAPQWQPRNISTAALALRQVLLVGPTERHAINWRSAELKTLINASDLRSIADKFDHRGGRIPSQVLTELSEMFRPKIYASLLSRQVKISGTFKQPMYRLTNWDLQIVNADWTLTTDQITLTGLANTSDIVSIPLPGTESSIVIPTNVDTMYRISWAAKPQITIAQTADSLASTNVTDIEDISQQVSQLDSYDRKLLRDVAAYSREPVAQVVAATLLLVGHTLASPVQTNI